MFFLASKSVMVRTDSFSANPPTTKNPDERTFVFQHSRWREGKMLNKILVFWTFSVIKDVSNLMNRFDVWEDDTKEGWNEEKRDQGLLVCHRIFPSSPLKSRINEIVLFLLSDPIFFLNPYVCVCSAADESRCTEQNCTHTFVVVPYWLQSHVIRQMSKCFRAENKASQSQFHVCFM